MEWWVTAIILFGSFLVLLSTGLPIAFSFGLINIAAVIILFGGGVNSLNVIIYGAYDSVASFGYIAVPMFILMGSVLMHTGLAFSSISAIEPWIGRVPGRLGVVAEAAGVIFGAASGSSMASTATIGKVLMPSMFKEGYARWLTIGSIACTGGIDMLIPPSALVVIFAGISMVPCGVLLVACIVPGVVIALCLAIFIMVAAKIKPEIAPAQSNVKFTLKERLNSLINIAPIAVLIVAVIGSIFFGIATPSESAASGAFASFVLAAVYRKLTFETIKKSIYSTVSVTSMTLIIITGSKVFSQVLAYSGISAGVGRCMLGLSENPFVVLFLMNVVVFILGCLIDQISIMLIIIPVFLPLATALGMDPVWWSIIMLINLGLGLITPPFGMNLFVVKGISPRDVTMWDIYRGIWPFVVIELVGMSIMILWPAAVTWLPSLMYKN